MRLITFLTILLSPILLYGEERFAVSEFFQTAYEAVEFANNLPNDLKASAQFIVEFDGWSERTGYAVVTDREFLRNNPHIPARHYSWYYRSNMPDFSYADRLIKEMIYGGEPVGPGLMLNFKSLRLQILSYWNPFLDSRRSTVTMFYIAVDGEPQSCSYNIVARQFIDKTAVLEFGNEKKDVGAMFSSETYIANRMESSFKIILSNCNSGVGGEWKLIENDEDGIPFNLTAAVEHMNEKDYKNINLVPLINLRYNRSRMAIFYQEK